MARNCPKCNRETAAEWQNCPFCGATLQANDNDVDIVALNEMAARAVKEKEGAYAKVLSKARVLCIRGMYAEARTVYDELLEDDPEDKNGYLGIIRVVTENFTVYEGKDIDEQIRIAVEVCHGAAALETDEEYKAYIERRKAYFEQKKAEEEERKRKEAQAIKEAERKRKEEEKRKEAECKHKEEEARKEAERQAQETERRRIEAKREETERKRKEEEARKEAERQAREAADRARRDHEEWIKNNFDIRYGNTLIRYKGTNTSVTVPDHVEEIGEAAFSYSDVTSVTLPKNLSRIGTKAFYGTKITNVYLPDGVYTVGKDAFPYQCRISAPSANIFAEMFPGEKYKLSCRG